MSSNTALWTVSVSASFALHLALGVALATMLAFQAQSAPVTTRISISTLEVRPAQETEMSIADEAAEEVTALPSEVALEAEAVEAEVLTAEVAEEAIAIEALEPPDTAALDALVSEALATDASADAARRR